MSVDRLAPLIQIVHTGGTIASRLDEKRRWLDVTSELVVLPASSTATGVRLREQSLFQIDSTNMRFDMIMQLAHVLTTALAKEEVTGVVVTHGTDTLEETALFLQLTTSSTKPIVVTGAQRPADAPDTDGPRNLSDSIIAASSECLVGLGAVVCFDGLLFSPWDVMKIDANAPRAFGSTDGPIGAVAGKKASISCYRPPALRFPVPSTIEEIEFVSTAMAAGSRAIRAAINEGVRGIVVAAPGNGNVSDEVTDLLLQAREQGMTVALARQAAAGWVEPRYRNAVRLSQAGVIFCGGLDAKKARILLALALSSDEDCAAAVFSATSQLDMRDGSPPSAGA